MVSFADAIDQAGGCSFSLNVMNLTDFSLAIQKTFI
jgi:hypothetical protein